MYNFNEYRLKAAETAIYPKGTDYPLLGLISEVGELAGVIKKQARDNTPDDIFKAKLLKELGACFWYVAAILTDYNFTLPESIDLHETINIKQEFYFLNSKVALFTDGCSHALTISQQIPFDKTSPLELDHLSRTLEAVFRQLIDIAHYYGLSLEEICEANLDKLFDRKERGVLGGSGDDR